MSSRHFSAARALLATALLGALAPKPASAATIMVFSHGNEHYVCQTRTWTVDGLLTVSPFAMVSSNYPTGELHLGELQPGAYGDSPAFERVELRCWVRDRHTSGDMPRADEKWYSIELTRDSAFWNSSHPDQLAPRRSLPRGGTRILLHLRAAGSPEQPTHIDITHAKASPAIGGPADSSDVYDLTPTPQLVRN